MNIRRWVAAGTRRTGLTLAGALLWALLPAAAWGDPAANQECLTCHGSHDLGSSRAGHSLFVSGGALSTSAHGRLECTSCHRDAKTVPHERALAHVRCGSCHAQVVKTVAAGVHGGSRERTEESCAACHGSAHTVTPATAGSRCMRIHKLCDRRRWTLARVSGTAW